MPFVVVEMYSGRLLRQVYGVFVTQAEADQWAAEKAKMTDYTYVVQSLKSAYVDHLGGEMAGEQR